VAQGAPTELRDALSRMTLEKDRIPLDLFDELLRHPTFGFRVDSLEYRQWVVPDPRPLLGRILRSDEDADFRRAVLRELTRRELTFPELSLREEDRKSQFLAALEDRAGRVRAYALSELADLCCDDAPLRRRLLGMLDDPSPEVRTALLWQLDDSGSEGVDLAVRLLTSGDYGGSVAEPLAATAVLAGRALDVLNARTDIETARLILVVITGYVDFEDERHLIMPFRGDLDRWFGKVPRSAGTVRDLAELAAALDETEFLRGLLTDSTLDLDARELILEAALDGRAARRLAISVAERWMLDTDAPVALRCLALRKVSGVIDEVADPEFARWRKMVRRLAKKDASIWIRQAAKECLPN